MKKLLIVIPLIFLIGCLTTNQVYLPYNSPIFHKKNCVALRNNPSYIEYPSTQSAINSGVTACSICIKTNQYTSSTIYKSSHTQYPYSYPSQVTNNQSNFINSYYGTSRLNRAPPSNGTKPISPIIGNRGVAENDSYYGEISKATGRPKTVYIKGYTRKDGTYVRGHYRSPPRKTQSTFVPLAPKPFNYTDNLPPIKKYKYTPIEFPVKGSGILGNNQTSILNRAPPSSGIISTTPITSNQGIAETGSYYGEISEATGRPKTTHVRGYYRKDGTYVRSHYRSPPQDRESLIGTTKSTFPIYSTPGVAENDSYYGQISETTGRPKTTHVRGYYRKDGTYVRGHYRSKPRR